MNETVVKGHEAGGSCACVCVFLQSCQFPENAQSSKADRVLLSFTTLSVVDKTLKHMVQGRAVIRAARRTYQTLNSEVMSSI